MAAYDPGKKLGPALVGCCAHLGIAAAPGLWAGLGVPPEGVSGVWKTFPL